MMKEVKEFFIEDNVLNKGYADNESVSYVGNSIYRKKIEDLLPPVDVLAAYEEIHPGTFSKLVDAFQKEQEHRHNLSKAYLAMERRGQKIGRMSGIFVICVAMYFATNLITSGMVVEGLVFLAMPFISMISISIMQRLDTKRAGFANHGRGGAKKNYDTYTRGHVRPRPQKERHVVSDINTVESAASAPVQQPRVQNSAKRQYRGNKKRRHIAE